MVLRRRNLGEVVCHSRSLRYRTKLLKGNGANDWFAIEHEK